MHKIYAIIIYNIKKICILALIYYNIFKNSQLMIINYNINYNINQFNKIIYINYNVNYEKRTAFFTAKKYFQSYKVLLRRFSLFSLMQLFKLHHLQM